MQLFCQRNLFLCYISQCFICASSHPYRKKVLFAKYPVKCILKSSGLKKHLPILATLLLEKHFLCNTMQLCIILFIKKKSLLFVKHPVKCILTFLVWSIVFLSLQLFCQRNFLLERWCCVYISHFIPAEEMSIVSKICNKIYFL